MLNRKFVVVVCCDVGVGGIEIVSFLDFSVVVLLLSCMLLFGVGVDLLRRGFTGIRRLNS